MTTQLVSSFGSYVPAEPAALLRPRLALANGSAKLVLGLHGHGANYRQLLPWTASDYFNLYQHVLALCDAGFAVLTMDYGGTTTFGGPIAMAAMAAAINWAQAQPGVDPGKIGLFGWSMGGLASLNFLKRNPAKVARAWLWSPLTSMAWAYSISSYHTEIDAAYGGIYPGPTAGWDALYDAQHTPAVYRNICPIHLSSDPADTGVPWQVNGVPFVDAVADPLVTKTSVTVGGGHNDQFRFVSPTDLAAFFDGAW